MTGIERHWREVEEQERMARQNRLYELRNKYAAILQELETLKAEFEQNAFQQMLNCAGSLAAMGAGGSAAYGQAMNVEWTPGKVLSWPY